MDELLQSGPWLLVIVATLVVSSAVVWSQLLTRFLRGEAILEHRPRRRVPWGFMDVASCFLLSVLLQVVALYVALGPNELTVETDDPRIWTVRAAAMAVSSLVTIVIAVAALRLMHGVRGEDLGVTAGRMLEDAWIGLMGFLAVAPPVYLLQMVLTQYVPAEHPLLDALDANTGHWSLFAASAAAAVAAAPALEELLCRTLLQGWLEKIWTALPWPRMDEEAIDPESGEPVEPPPPPDDAPPQGDWLDLGPVVISAALFAALHTGQGPSPAPLFVFALALGYVYRRTHSVVAPWVMHVCLNATSLAAMLAEFAGSAP